jgi:hypothetical protein
MNVKGFIMEDDHGKEFVVVCEKPYKQSGKSSLSGAGNDGEWFRCNVQSKSFTKSPGEC